MQRGDLWVFGYGSLMWNPGFAYLERRIARLDGFQRRFALTSRHYRGTPEKPGLVLGLDWAPGESCTGMAFRICPSKEQEVRDYLVERELVSYAYFETRHPVTLLCEGAGQGEAQDALCYVVDRSHPQYAGQMEPQAQAEIIADAVGPSGPNYEYLMNTLEQLQAIGIPDPNLTAMAEQVRRARLASITLPDEDLSELIFLDRVDRQAGALAWRMDPVRGFEFVIVTSRRTGRWVLPKGSIDKGHTEAEAAAQEAWEEAGVVGAPAEEPIALYRTRKIRPPNVWALEVAIYPIRIAEVLDNWPESDQRERRFVTVNEAAGLLNDSTLLNIIAHFGAAAS